MLPNGLAELNVEKLPREVRDGLSSFCKANGITLPILMEWVYDVLYNPRNLEAVSKGIEMSLAKWDPAKYRGSGPWHSPARRHEFGLYGIWVRIPVNRMKNNGEQHERDSTQATS